MMVQERLWIEHHSPHHLPLQTHHPHPRTNIVCPISPENGFGSKDMDSPSSSDSEDLHYGPGIVNRLRNKYLSLALRESNTRPTILRKATSLENLLDDDGEDEEGEKEHPRLFTRRNIGNDGGNRYRSSNRRQEMKRARSVEVISRASHEEELTLTSSVTAKINNRQSLHEDMLTQNHDDKAVLIENTRPYKKPVSIENGTDDTADKYSRRINRPKRIPPLLNEKEKPPVDVVKHAKLIFEKRPETRTKKPHHTGDVAAKVDSFNEIIVKTKGALKPTKPTVKNSKPVLYDKCKSNTHHHVRPVAKPVILSEEITKPKSLNIMSPKQEKKGFSSLPSPIPDVSRVEIKPHDGSDPRNNSINSLCETPDLILTSSPIPKINSPTYRKRSTEDFIKEERNRPYLGHTEAANKYVSPSHSPTKALYNKPTSLNFNREELDSPGIKMISPISQRNITKSAATSVFNFVNSQVDQRHLPATKQKSPSSERPESEVNGFDDGINNKPGLTAFELEKNLRNVKSSTEVIDKPDEEPTEPLIALESKNEDLKSDSEKNDRKTVDVVPKKPEIIVREKDKLGQDLVGTKPDDANKSKQNICNSVEKNSSVFESLTKTGKHVPSSFEPAYKTNNTASEPSSSVETPVISTESSNHIEEKSKLIEHESVVTNKPATDVENKTNKVLLKTVQNKSASDKKCIVNEDKPVKIVLPKKTKPRQEESTTAVFNFTSRKDVPDYISNDTSRTPSRPVIPKLDEPGIKLLPEAFKEIQEVWEEDELIRSLETRPPSPCDVTFINDNIVIDGKSSFIQQTSKRVKLKISFVDDAEIYEYPSETSLMLEEIQISTMAGSAQVGHTVPTLSGSSLATYTPKTTEDFQLGVTKSFQEPIVISKPDVADTLEEPQAEIVLEEIEKPVLFSSGSTSDILF